MARVLVVGGGPAGMMAALTARQSGWNVTLLERNEKLGKKLYITGKGRCNLTNAVSRQEFLTHVPRNARFLYSALDALDSFALMELVEGLGVPLVVERGQRVFPASMKSSDINRAFEAALRREGVEIRLQSRVRELLIENGRVLGVCMEDGSALCAQHVIVATGGLSYPATGSTGDGFRWAEHVGHRVSELSPALVPIETADTWIPSLQGISLKNVMLTARWGGKKRFEELGEMMFAHFGITGPLVLKLSSLLDPQDVAKAQVSVNLKPGLRPEQLDARVLRDLQERANQQLSRALGALLPARMLDVVLRLAEVPAEKRGHQLTAKERGRIVDLLQALPIHLRQLRGWEEAVITRGGVDVRGIDPRTMASKTVPGLSFAGEILDVDGFTGGFNLQIAFATGYCAGRNIPLDR